MTLFSRLSHQAETALCKTIIEIKTAPSQRRNDIETIFPLLVLTRWLHFASLSVLFGCSFFWLSIEVKHSVETLSWAACVTNQIEGLAAIVAALSGVAWLVVSIANMTGSFADMVDAETIHAFLFETPFGPIAIARLILLLCLVVAAWAPSASSLRLGLIALVSALLMISQAWLGHAAEGGATLGGALMIAIYAVHLLSAAAWAGGLPALALALAERRRQGDGGYDILARYSMMAIIAVSLVILSGIANTAFHVDGAIARLPFTAYGAVLFTKLMLVAAMLALAAINRFIIMPRLRVAGPIAGPVGQMRISLSVELLLATVVLGAAAVLGLTPPPH